MINYDEVIYDQIIDEEEVQLFLVSIYEYSKRIYDSIIEKLEDKLYSIKIDYSEIFTLIQKLNETGIVITNNEDWFGIENHYTRGKPDRKEIEAYFFSAKYNDIHILDADFVYIVEMVIRNKNQKRTPRFICRSQLEYDDWIRQHKSINAIEKKLKKLMKQEKKQEQKLDKPWGIYNPDFSNKLTKTKEIFETGKELENKLEFLYSLSDEQMEIMDKIWRVFINISEDYFTKRLDVETEIEQNKKTKLENSAELFNEAYLKLTKEKADEINMKSIETKLAKLLILNGLNKNEYAFWNFFSISHNKTEYEKLIDWFIELKDEEISDIINLFTENIDELLQEQKVLKK